ncbi:hypothetical protein AAFC00_004519 [Neodothiora populina]|uniref:Uncharacterized protein n=1 Tax=Neodothiora populina TaxID=2781224 RepID=A0ABR3P299_9PEZI
MDRHIVYTRDVTLPSDIRYDRTPPWEIPVSAKVPYEPQIPNKQGLSPSMVQRSREGSVSRSKRSASSPPYTKTFGREGGPPANTTMGPTGTAGSASRSNTAPVDLSSMPTHKELHLLPSRLENLRKLDTEIRHATGRSSSVPSPTNRHDRSQSRPRRKTDKMKAQDSVPWSRRLKDAVKDLFKKDPIDDNQYEEIEDRHWTDY